MALASVLGWTIAQVERDIDPVRLRGLIRFWEEFPPPFMALRALTGAQSPGASAHPSSVAPSSKIQNNLVDQALTGGVDGLPVNRVSPKFYKDFVHRLHSSTDAYVEQLRKAKVAGNA